MIGKFSFYGDYPSWWRVWTGFSPLWPWLLLPLMWLYIALSALRNWWVRPSLVPVPVVCVGNITVGGVGKTPVLMQIARGLQQRGIAVHVLGHGYNASQKSVHCVDALQDTAALVGDEALMLAAIVPTWIGGTRVARARAAINAGAALLLMDDGWQDPKLHKDYIIAVIDATYPWGNGWRLPLGPLRQRPDTLSRADQIIAVQNHSNATRQSSPMLVSANTVLQRICQWRDQPPKATCAVVFCGIGQSCQFFDAAKDLCHKTGIDIVMCISFSDHYLYQTKELSRLREDHPSAALVTTLKDWQRLDATWRAQVSVIDLHLIDQARHYPDNIVSSLVTLVTTHDQ